MSSFKIIYYSINKKIKKLRWVRSDQRFKRAKSRKMSKQVGVKIRSKFDRNGHSRNSIESAQHKIDRVKPRRPHTKLSQVNLDWNLIEPASIKNQTNLVGTAIVGTRSIQFWPKINQFGWVSPCKKIDQIWLGRTWPKLGRVGLNRNFSNSTELRLVENQQN